MIRRPPRSTLSPTRRSSDLGWYDQGFQAFARRACVTARAESPRSAARAAFAIAVFPTRSEEHTSELQSRSDLVCRLLLEKKKKNRVKRRTEQYCAEATRTQH